MDKRKRPRGVSIGITSVVVMFAVIAMTIFAVLSLSTAIQEKKLADAFAGAVSAYWKADAECAGAADEFGALWEAGADLPEIRKAASGYGAECWEENGAVHVAYIFEIDGARALSVHLELGSKFSILSWKTVAADENAWQPDDSLDVWMPENVEVTG